MTVPMHVRALAIASAKKAREIEDRQKIIDANKFKLAEWGYDLPAVLIEIEKEEAETRESGR